MKKACLICALFAMSCSAPAMAEELSQPHSRWVRPGASASERCTRMALPTKCFQPIRFPASPLRAARRKPDSEELGISCCCSVWTATYWPERVASRHINIATLWCQHANTPAPPAQIFSHSDIALAHFSATSRGSLATHPDARSRAHSYSHSDSFRLAYAR